MIGFPPKLRSVLVAILGVALAGLASTAAHAQKPHVTKVKPKKGNKNGDASQSAEPDKVLYDRAMVSLKKTKFIEARLDLQTLINTYPDSEYLAKAKLAIADSYYKEGGTSNLTQSVEEYKNFIVFFPFLDEAAYAQMQVGMAHYRMMEKADRDNSQAEYAEDEFRTFLLKYPQSPLVPQAEQYLRNVQEVLADGEFRIARFYYYTKRDYRASAARLVELSNRYPLYSQGDLALSMLGNIYMRAKQVSKNEDDKNHWADLAGQCYTQIVRDYPLSKLALDAKAKLTSMGMPVPKADTEAINRMQKQLDYEKEHHPNAVTKYPMGMIKSSPDIAMAARSGTPNLNPPDDTVSATDVLNQGAAGPSFSITARALSSGNDSASTDTESVETSSSGDTTAGAQIIAAPTSAAAAAAPEAAPPPPSTMTSISTAAPEATSEPANAAPPATATAESPAPPAQSAQVVSNSTSGTNGATQPAQSTSQSSTSKSDPKSESTSKKKKGLHKIIP